MKAHKAKTVSLFPSNIVTLLLPVLCCLGCPAVRIMPSCDALCNAAAEVERVTVIAILDSDKESPASGREPGRGRGNIFK